MEIRTQKTNEEALIENRRKKTDRRKKEIPVDNLSHKDRRKDERRNS